MQTIETRQVPLSLLRPPSRPHRAAFAPEPLAELCQSLQAEGQIQAVVIRPVGGEFEIVVGHRRWLAATRLGWESLRCEIRAMTDREVTRARAHENSKRDDLSPLERAMEAQAVLEACDNDIDAAALALGVSRSTVDAWLDILTWPRDVQAALDLGQIPRGVAKWLAKFTDDADRAHHLRYAVSDGCTEDKARFWYHEYVKRGVIAQVGPQGASPGWTPEPPPDPTWLCYLHLRPVSLASLFTIKVCAQCAAQIAANRPAGVSQDPQAGLL